MLLNVNTLETCFLSPSIHIKNHGQFFLICFLSFLSVIALEFLRRCQRRFDARFIASSRFHSRSPIASDDPPDDFDEEKSRLASSIRSKCRGKNIDAGEIHAASQTCMKTSRQIFIEQTARGALHTLQLAISYTIMLLVMYCNGKNPESDHLSISDLLLWIAYIILSILLGAMVGFAIFTRDTVTL